MVLLSHRPDTQPPLMSRAAQSIIRLAPLTSDGTRALVGSFFGTLAGDVLGRLQDFVADRAGGNPLFVEEIVRSLVNKGVLVRHGDRWACTAGLRRRRRSTHAARAAPVACRPLARRRAAPAPGDGCARASVRGDASPRRRDGSGVHRGHARSSDRGRSDPVGRARTRGQAVPVHPRAGARSGLSEPAAVAPHRATRASGPCARARHRSAPGPTE